VIDVPDPVIWSVVRSVFVATIALALAQPLRRVLDAATEPSRSIGFVAVLAPLFVPDLLLGFTYRLTAARIVGFTAGTEMLYASLLVMRSIPVALLIHMLLPRPLVTRESIFLWDQLRGQSASHLRWRWHWLLMRLNGPWRPGIAAWCLMALLSFQEFETAALMQVDLHPITWTVWLFDAHSSWQPISDSLGMLRYPLGFESLLLIPVAIIVMNTRPTVHHAEKTEYRGPVSHLVRSGGVLVAVLIVVSLLAMPVILNSELILKSLQLATQSSAFLRTSLEQTAVSLGFGMAAAVMTLVLGNWCLRSKWRLPLLVPGLWGALTCSLFWLAVFQQPVVRPAYDTWLPLLFGLVSTNLPRAVIVLAVMRELIDPAAVHSAVLLRTSHDAAVRRFAVRLLWRFVDARWLLAGAMLTHWCFWDVTTVAILRPVDLEPVITRLYNEMHYGRTEALAMATGLACLATPLTALLIAGVWRFVRRR